MRRASIARQAAKNVTWMAKTARTAIEAVMQK
jgi:hypothetical protein